MAETIKIENEFLKVHCPCCENGRLFDVGAKAKGVIRIKCPICKNAVEIKLEKCDRSRQRRLNAYYRKCNL